MHMNTNSLSELKGITFGSLNIRSVVSKIDDVATLLDRSKLDVLCLQETFLNESTSSAELEVPKYKFFRADGLRDTCKSAGGGLLFYHGSQYEFTSIDEWGVCSRDIECQWVKMSLKDTRPTYIGNLYRPPDGNVDAAIEYLNGIMHTIYSGRNLDVLLLGDLNIDLLKRGGSVNKYKRFLNGNLLNQLVLDPTRISNTGATLIDHIITNNTDYYVCGVIDPGLSDHLMTYTSRKRLKIKFKTDFFLWKKLS